MSKRHQSSRRRSYGRRQHELRERTERHDLGPADEYSTESGDTDRGSFGYLDLEPRRLSFAVSD
jgi:hypothetical protein